MCALTQQTELLKGANKEDTVYAGRSTTVYNLSFSTQIKTFLLVLKMPRQVNLHTVKTKKIWKNQTKAYSTGLGVPFFWNRICKGNHMIILMQFGINEHKQFFLQANKIVCWYLDRLQVIHESAQKSETFSYSIFRTPQMNFNHLQNTSDYHWQSPSVFTLILDTFVAISTVLYFTFCKKNLQLILANLDCEQSLFSSNIHGKCMTACNVQEVMLWAASSSTSSPHITLTITLGSGLEKTPVRSSGTSRFSLRASNLLSFLPPWARQAIRRLNFW